MHAKLPLFIVALAALSLAFLGHADKEQQSRSSEWPKVRAAHLAAEPYCRVCGSVKELEVHHEREFHRYPELELLPSNLITLCRHCHYAVGHLETSWKTNNYAITAVFGAASNSTGYKVWLQKNGKK